jgi:hypothetical protein
MEIKNKSEELFEQYLDLNGFKGRWTYEPQIPGKSTRPDYLLTYNNQECFFEVKELTKKDNEPVKFPAYIDPYISLRTEIHDVRKQFKQFRDYSCSLIVYNIDDKQVRLDPLTILGAMLGNLGFEMNIDALKGKAVVGTEKNVFLNGGKMVNNKKGQPQNTTINAIIVLEEFRDDSEIQKAIKKKIKNQDKLLTSEEHFAVAHEVIIKEHHTSKSVLRVSVIENPFARIAFPDGLFTGSFDERWRYTIQTGSIERIFVGNKLRELEILKNKNKRN